MGNIVLERNHLHPGFGRRIDPVGHPRLREPPRTPCGKRAAKLCDRDSATGIGTLPLANRDNFGS